MFEEDREEMNELRKQEFERRNAGSKGSVQTYTLTYPTSFWPIGQHSDLSHHSLTYPYYIFTYTTTFWPIRQRSVLSHYILTYPTAFWPISTTYWPISLHSDLYVIHPDLSHYILTYSTILWPIPLHSDLSNYMIYVHYILTYPTTFWPIRQHSDLSHYILICPIIFWPIPLNFDLSPLHSDLSGTLQRECSTSLESNLSFKICCTQPA